MSSTMRWIALALLGVLVAVGVSIAASGLVSQQIGLSSEPISAGDALAPRAVRTTHQQEPRHSTGARSPSGGNSTPPPVTTEAQPPTAEPEPPLPSSPSGGEGDHSGGGADD